VGLVGPSDRQLQPHGLAAITQVLQLQGAQQGVGGERQEGERGEGQDRAAEVAAGRVPVDHAAVA
jgi:hypothetical protein